MTLEEDLLRRSEKLVFGTERVLKLMKNDKLEKIYLSENCREDVKIIIGMYGKKIEVVNLAVPNTELGVICKKPFSISAVGVKK